MKLHILFLVVSALVATTAATEYPSEYESDSELQENPEVKGDNPTAMYEEIAQYLSEYESDSELQEYPEVMGDYPTAMYEEIADLQYRKIHTIGVEHLKIGQTVEVVYRSPNKGRVSVNLAAAKTDIILHIDARYKWHSWKNSLHLTSFHGHWQKEQRPKGFPFPCEGVTTITLRITVAKKYFIISANGIEITKYRFRGSLTPNKVVKVQCALDDSTASKKAKVEKMSISY